MDNDGDLDMITARVINDGPITPIDQDLLWFENDGTPASREQWKMHRIAGKFTSLNLISLIIKNFWDFENFIKPKIMPMFSFLWHNFHEWMAKELKLSLLLEPSMLKDLNWSGPKIQT